MRSLMMSDRLTGKIKNADGLKREKGKEYEKID